MDAPAYALETPLPVHQLSVPVEGADKALGKIKSRTQLGVSASYDLGGVTVGTAVCGFLQSPSRT
ncbi:MULTISPECIES: hypothetical protein [Pseudomonas]|uniref:hypothetical protein n=1 Tax=Pseudomonas TaxID=286 RepID=UPI001643533A|nr:MULTISPECIES: hypothetical protein [Pseudomonas]MBJ2180276.1 hypothetical protein [Pseudomonas veronii]MDF3240065.1 hypothetical protein [Pseudomonas veronii]